MSCRYDEFRWPRVAEVIGSERSRLQAIQVELTLGQSFDGTVRVVQTPSDVVLANFLVHRADQVGHGEARRWSGIAYRGHLVRGLSAMGRRQL